MQVQLLTRAPSQGLDMASDSPRESAWPVVQSSPLDWGDMVQVDRDVQNREDGPGSVTPEHTDWARNVVGRDDQEQWRRETVPRETVPVRVRRYGGVVQEVSTEVVVAWLSTPDGDGFLGAIPLASFPVTPLVGQEVACRMETEGAATRIAAWVVDPHDIPSARDLGIDPQEFEAWGSKLEI